MATAPIFFATPFNSHAQISAANTGLDGSGTLVDLFAAQASALKIERINIKAIVSIAAAGMVRLFVYDGTNARLLVEVPVPVLAKSASVAAWSTSLDFTRPEDALILPAGWKLQAGTEKADTFNLLTIGALAG